MELASEILSNITVHMKYAKYLPEKNRRETWEELVDKPEKSHEKDAWEQVAEKTRERSPLAPK